jgi:hypothetical protein
MNSLSGFLSRQYFRAVYWATALSESRRHRNCFVNFADYRSLAGLYATPPFHDDDCLQREHIRSPAPRLSKFSSQLKHRRDFVSG